MVVDCHREHTFCSCLTNDILVENRANFSRSREFLKLGLVLRFLQFFADNVVTELDTFITDIHRRAGNQLSYLVLTFAAEIAVQ